MNTVAIFVLGFGAAWVILGALMVAARRADDRLENYDVPDWVNESAWMKEQNENRRLLDAYYQDRLKEIVEERTRRER